MNSSSKCSCAMVPFFFSPLSLGLSSGQRERAIPYSSPPARPSVSQSWLAFLSDWASVPFPNRKKTFPPFAHFLPDCCTTLRRSIPFLSLDRPIPHPLEKAHCTYLPCLLYRLSPRSVFDEGVETTRRERPLVFRRLFSSPSLSSFRAHAVARRSPLSELPLSSFVEQFDGSSTRRAKAPLYPLSGL